jgi:hypothetical protein
LHQVRLIHVLDRLRILAEGRRERFEAHGATGELVDDRREQRAVDSVEALVIDLERGERLARDRERHSPVVSHLREVAHSLEPTVGDPRRPSRTSRDLVRGGGLDLDPEDARRAPHDLLERFGLEQVELVRRAEPVAQRR